MYQMLFDIKLKSEIYSMQKQWWYKLLMIQIVDDIKRVTKDETKMEFYEAIHEFITVLAASNFGDQIDATRNQVEQVLDASEDQYESVAA